jgi:hypothetical protein
MHVGTSHEGRLVVREEERWDRACQCVELGMLIVVGTCVKVRHLQ